MSIGGAIRRIRAGEDRSLLARCAFRSPSTIAVTSPAFSDGEPIPRRHAGEGVGDDVSPALRWRGVPPGAAALVLLIDDVDVPLPRPLWHGAAVLPPDHEDLAEGGFRRGAGIRIVPTMLGRDGYSGPRPIPGHGAHRYRFHVLALDRPVPQAATSVRSVLTAAASHVLARGTLTGTYQR